MNSQAASEAFYAALLDDAPEELFERAPCGYLTTTPDGTVVKTNGTFCSLTGYTREQLVGQRTFAELLTVGRIYHETHYAPMLRTVREVAFELVRSDGERLPVLVNAVLEVDADDHPELVRVAVFDATHRREYERVLLRAKERAEQSEGRARALARTLQSTLIPPSPPSLPGLDVSAGYRPAGNGEEVGGDFYDIFQIKTGDWVVALGDVCRKGVYAAVVTALMRYTLRAPGHRGPSRRRVLRRAAAAPGRGGAPRRRDARRAHPRGRPRLPAGTARDDIAVVAVRVPPMSDRAQPPFRTEPSS